MAKAVRMTAGAALIAAAAVGVWRLGGEEPSPDPAKGSDRAIAVRTSRIESARVAEPFEAAGSFVARERLMLAAERPSRVVEILIEDAAEVAAGEPLIRFEDAAERAELEAAQAELDEASAEERRARELFEAEVLSETLLEDRIAASSRAMARVANARTALDDRLLRAPFAGRIGRVEVSPGAYVAPGEPLLELSTTTRHRVLFAVPVEIAEKLKEGTNVSVRLEPGVDPQNATIELVERMARRDDRLVEVEARLDQTPEELIPGRLVQVTVPAGTGEASLLVPQTAIEWAGPQAFVYLVDPQKRAKRSPVEIGPRRGDRIVVRGDSLREGLAVVSLGLQKIRDGDRIETDTENPQ